MPAPVLLLLLKTQPSPAQQQSEKLALLSTLLLPPLLLCKQTRRGKYMRREGVEGTVPGDAAEGEEEEDRILSERLIDYTKSCPTWPRSCTGARLSLTDVTKGAIQRRGGKDAILTIQRRGGVYAIDALLKAGGMTDHIKDGGAGTGAVIPLTSTAGGQEEGGQRDGTAGEWKGGKAAAFGRKRKRDEAMEAGEAAQYADNVTTTVAPAAASSTPVAAAQHAVEQQQDGEWEESSGDEGRNKPRQPVWWI